MNPSSSTPSFDACAEAAHSDVSPFLAALDEETYCQAILPLLDRTHETVIDTRDDEEAEAALHSDPIPGHFHYLDRGYW